MTRVSVSEVRKELSRTLNRASRKGRRIMVQRRGKDLVAIIPAEDLRLFEHLLEVYEDRLDLEAAKAAEDESDERIPYGKVRRDLGLE
jgi:prevent-host-death family protein